MDMGSLLVILALAIVVGAIVARPFFEDRNQKTGSGGQKQSILLAEEEKVLATLQELDMDHAMGKVPPQEYQAQRASLVAKGAALLKALDEIGGTDSLGPRLAGTAEDDIEAEIARRRRGRASAGGYCGQCGKPVVVGDRFCSHCGAALTVGAPAR